MHMKLSDRMTVLGCFHIVMPSVCAIRTKMILNTSSRFPIPICQKIVWITTGCFLIISKVYIFGKMVIVLLEHWDLHPQKKKKIWTSGACLREETLKIQKHTDKYILGNSFWISLSCEKNKRYLTKRFLDIISLNTALLKWILWSSNFKKNGSTKEANRYTLCWA
jgi:hypothetical protein